ncbi:uncharacterized protein LOC113297541 isoform X2 [Papaver somniferum]|uniref:uncharacterized protein LOC113297541 isoform X2 n=1 Tax=Papaver somniferum TaxID=3469 RepID=UPI000E7050D6|nr:uncharacterized protein LOC113297541 isoform X2 [Papaver somniferum]
MGSKGDIKGFFRQKKSSGVTKPNNKTTKSSSSFSKKAATTLGSDQTQPSALISHGSLDLKEILRQFDMNMKYGPCIGMTRLARWERAKNLGMNPPKEIETCLRQAKVGLECLWSSRV